MSIEPSDFRSRLRALVDLQGAVLTEEELSHMAEGYPRCRGKEHWDVREYVRLTKVGAREYRVVRGSSVLRGRPGRARPPEQRSGGGQSSPFGTELSK